MAIVRMQKVAILAHANAREDVIDFLHGAGVLHITDSGEESLPVDHTQVDFKEAELQFAIDVLKDHANKKTIAESEASVSMKDIVDAAKHTDVRGIVQKLHEREEQDTNAERLINEKIALQEQLHPWLKLPYDLDASLETDFCIRILGTLPKQNVADMRADVKKEKIKVDLHHVGSTSSEEAFSALVWKEDLSRFEELVTRHGWSNVQLPAVSGTAKEVYEEAESVQKKSLDLRAANKAVREKMSTDLPALVRTQRFYEWLHEKQSAREAMRISEETIALYGWMPAANVKQVEADLKKVSKATALLEVQPGEGEEPPVAIKNNKLITPFQSVTTLYGLPLPNEMDPTFPLAPFFILFFALCLTDAGYGAVLTLIFGVYLFKSKQSIEDAPLWWLIFLGGIMTFLVGILFGGWFGLSPDQVPEFFTYMSAEEELLFKGQLWNLGKQSGIAFLQNLSLVLGLIHLFFGMFLAGYHKWVHGQKARACWEDFSAHLLLAAVLFSVLAPENMATIAQYTLYGVIALFIWGKGYGNPWYLRPIMGLLGAVNFGIGLLSNSLSYLRILALGLVTGAIAAAVNQVAIEMGKLFPVFLAIPLIIVICVVGHLVSIALNTLGTFIHSGRLQFIEFFSQFFEGGGRGYTPFKRSSL